MATHLRLSGARSEAPRRSADATRTAGPRCSTSATSAAAVPASVITSSICPMSSTLHSARRPNFEWSTSRITRAACSATICLMRNVAIADSNVPSSGKKPLVERNATSTKNRRADSSAVGPTKHALDGSNCPPRPTIVFSVVRPNSRHTSAECVTTVRPRNCFARQRARNRHVVLPSRNTVCCGLTCRRASCGNLLLLATLDREPLLHGRFIEVLRRVGRLHAAQRLDQAAAADQFVDVPTNRHLRHAETAGQLLVGARPHRVEVIDNRQVSFALVHRRGH